MNLKRLLCWIGICIVSLTWGVGCTQSQFSIYQTSQIPFINATPFRLGFSNWSAFMVWTVTEEHEIFEKNKLDVNLKFHDYLTSVKLMSEGKLDGNNETLNDTLVSLEGQKIPQKVVVFFSDISLGGDQVIARPGINKISDLKGKKIATELGSVDHYLLLLGLKKAGINPQDIQLINLDMRLAVATFLEGKLDAIAAFMPLSKDALTLPGSQVLFTSKDFPGAIVDLVVVSRKKVKEHPEEVQALVNSWFDTLDLIKKNPDKTYQEMAEQSGLTINQLKNDLNQLKLFNLAENLEIFSSGINSKSLEKIAAEMNQFLLENKIINTPTNLDLLFEDRFVKKYAELTREKLS